MPIGPLGPLATINNHLYYGRQLRETILKINRRWWIFRYFPEKEYREYLTKIHSFLQTETSEQSNHMKSLLSRQLAKEKMFRGRCYTEVDTMYRISDQLKRCIKTPFQTEKRKQLLSVSKVLNERLVEDSYFRDNPIEPALIEQIGGFLQEMKFTMGAKNNLIHQ